jgi:hypothetical protein
MDCCICRMRIHTSVQRCNACYAPTHAKCYRKRGIYKCSGKADAINIAPCVVCGYAEFICVPQLYLRIINESLPNEIKYIANDPECYLSGA